MIRITIPKGELFDENTQEFVYIKEQTLQLEHSLMSLSKWESKWNKPFLGNEPKTIEETIDYIQCMTITPNVDPIVYRFITEENINQVSEYIQAPMTATWFSDADGKPSKEIITAEIIYYWMIAFNIPFECQKWHLNRLLTLVKVCSIKNEPPKKMSKSALLNRNKALNEARKRALNSEG